MNKTLIFPAVIVAILVLVVGFFVSRQSTDVVLEPTITPPSAAVTTNVYRDANLGFSVTLPTALSSTTHDSRYHVDEVYEYTALGSGKSIKGVKFTVPQLMNTGTNLSSDSYVSVEHIGKEQVCQATAFLVNSELESQTIVQGTRSYSFASSSEAAAGNRYEEYVYALPGLDACLAVRYFIHYGAMDNYGIDEIKEFNRTKLFADFDSIRNSLVIN
jgi:hypothetical protein